MIRQIDEGWGNTCTDGFFNPRYCQQKLGFLVSEMTHVLLGFRICRSARFASDIHILITFSVHKHIFSGFKHFTTEKKNISNPKGGNISRILANPQSTGAGASLLIPMLWRFPTGLYDRASAEDYLK